MQGLTIFARVKAFKQLNGVSLLDIHEDVLRGFDKQTAKAVRDAVKNYKDFVAKEEEKRKNLLLSADTAAI